MRELELKSVIKVCQMEELTAEEQHLLELAIEATGRHPISSQTVGSTASTSSKAYARWLTVQSTSYA